MFLWGKDASSRLKFRPGDLSTDCAGRDLHLRIVADPLGFAHGSPGHHVELAVVFSKPDRRRHTCARFAKGRERDVLLLMNSGRNWIWHGDIVDGARIHILHGYYGRISAADRSGSQVSLRIALIPQSVLQA